MTRRRDAAAKFPRIGIHISDFRRHIVKILDFNFPVRPLTQEIDCFRNRASPCRAPVPQVQGSGGIIPPAAGGTSSPPRFPYSTPGGRRSFLA